MLASESSYTKHHDNNEWDIDFETVLGKGARCIGVYLGKKKKNTKYIPQNIECAIKISEEYKNNENEIKVLDKLINIKHKNIIDIYDYAFGHHKGDIKCDNILSLLIDGKIESLKLIDFDISKFYGDKNNSKYSSICGTPTHMAPEVLINNSKASSKSDIWSIGCTLIEMAGGSLVGERPNGIPDIPSHLSNKCRNFIQHCLIFDSESRPKAKDLVTHDFIVSIQKKIGQCNNIKNIPVELKNSELDKLCSIGEEVTQITLQEFNDISLGFDLNQRPTKSITLILPLFNQELNFLETPIRNLSVTSLILPSFNKPIPCGSIPSTLISLTLTSFNQMLDDESIPETVSELVLGKDFKFNENGGNLPPSIKKFTCSYDFKSPLRMNNNIPKNALEVILDNYNYPIIKNSIPETVHTLTLGENFKDLEEFKSFSNLPPSVINLTFGVCNCHFSDEQIKEYIPNNISSITIKRKNKRKYNETLE
ncbi:hypothetical protein DICPUDRAFT_98488 [Dictyostelium purpureum]|uniref:Protein kinase domain-containing protein n=1 Tax=Dictyostelium purpureum TaxID=5786 RepID=F0ZQS8_DICPU|nr:uncharacterized protein DICPUDRAFT_98488 [Dictyostelium purpureum]EGC33705.1 hypothetical protein DICPUDRAFT_98488 [Dictyostelium purpureum]|eukprot:XP_003289782.1 hypothetical protein DICPUDRAFT_98488 [Dictyostelium purpureum]